MSPRKRKVMKSIIISISMLTLGVLLLISQVGRGQALSADEKIKSAMSAAPPIIGQNAVIVDTVVDKDGKEIVLRAGTNGWTCNPDDPNTPGNYPICYDKVWADWFAAAAAGKKPGEAIKDPALASRYQGGSHASMT